MQRFVSAYTRKSYGYPLLLLWIGLLIFHSVLFKGFILDDRAQIIDNPAVHTINYVPTFFVKSLHYTEDVSYVTGFTYRPITYASYTVLYALGKGNPFPFHAFLLALYITNAILVYYVFLKFTKPLPSFLLALLFLVHPANQEIATYIADIQDVLYFFFGISALLFVLKREPHTRDIFLCGIVLLASCLSKETGILFLPAVFIAVMLFKRHLLRNYAFVLSTTFLCYFLLRLYAGQTPFLTIAVPISSTVQHMQISTHLLLIPKMLGYYILFIVMPLPALPISFLTNTNPALSIIVFLLVVCVYAGAVALGLLLKKKRPSAYKGYLFFFFLFLLSTVFHSQLIPLDVLVSKRWVYVQLFAAIGMFGIAIQSFYPYFRKQRRLLLIFYALYVLILLIETTIALSYY